MRILVIGGHGFLGQHLVGQLKEKGHQVIARSRRDGLDLCNLENTKAVLAEVKPDVIYNCAAHVGSIHYVSEHRADVIYDNLSMGLNLYQAVSQVCPKACVVNPLSNCSYPGDADIQTESEWWDGEVHDSVCAYANSKRMIQVISKSYAKQKGIRSINFLVPNAFGPGDYTDPNRTHALNGMIMRMIGAKRKNEQEFEIWGTGKPIREWGYIKDIARVMIEGLDVDADLTSPVNIGQNHGYSIADSAQLIAKAVGFGGKLVFNPKYQDGAPTKILDDKKFRSLFPKFKFSDHGEGIKDTVAYYNSVL